MEVVNYEDCIHAYTILC